MLRGLRFGRPSVIANFFKKRCEFSRNNVNLAPSANSTLPLYVFQSFSDRINSKIRFNTLLMLVAPVTITG